MVDSFQKRQRERLKREKRAEKRAKRKERSEHKQARPDGEIEVDPAYADMHAEALGDAPIETRRKPDTMS